MSVVPVIDIAPFGGSDAERRVVGARVASACERVGFLTIVNHGVPASVIDACWERSAAFFDSSIENRSGATSPRPGHPYGYHGLAREALAQSLGDATPPDLKETFNVGPLERPDIELDDDAIAFAYADNLWPERPAGFREALEAYYRALNALAGRVMEIFAVALGLRADFFAGHIDHPLSALRVINYPELERPPLPGQLRAGSHSDYGTLTLLLQRESVGGLQVFSEGRWHDVPSVPGAFVVNIGDLMARWTNDRWISTLHRVVNPPPDAGKSTRRQSIAFFHTPNWNAEVSCIPTCIPDGQDPRHVPVRAGPYLAAKFTRTVQAL